MNSAYFKPVDELTFTDDYMFGAVMRDPEICAGVIERLLKIKVGRIEYPELQKMLKPAYESKGVRFDVYVKDSDRVFDVEIQNRIVGDLPKRARYYQSMIDMDCLLRGKDYESLPESFVIFICKSDPFGLSLPCYTFRNMCTENGSLMLDDKTARVFYNVGAYENSKDDELKAFLHFVCKNEAEDEFTRSLEERVRTIIDSEKFRTEYLAVNLHDRDLIKEGKREGIEIGIAQGISKGARDKALETARTALGMNLSLDQIKQLTGLTEEEIRNLSKN